MDSFVLSVGDVHVIKWGKTMREMLGTVHLSLVAGYKCMCLNARSIVNKKYELNMIEDIEPHITGITETWANKDITDAEL